MACIIVTNGNSGLMSTHETTRITDGYLPVPNTEEGLAFWEELAARNLDSALRKLGRLEKLNLSWATELALQLIEEEA